MVFTVEDRVVLCAVSSHSASLPGGLILGTGHGAKCPWSEAAGLRGVRADGTIWEVVSQTSKSTYLCLGPLGGSEQHQRSFLSCQLKLADSQVDPTKLPATRRFNEQIISLRAAAAASLEAERERLAADDARRASLMASLASRVDTTPRDRTTWMGSFRPVDSAKSSIALPRPYQTGRHMVDETAAGTLYMRDGDGLQSPEQYAPVGAEVARRLRPGGGGFEGLNVQGDDSNGKNGHTQMFIVDVQPESFHPDESVGQRRTDPMQ